MLFDIVDTVESNKMGFIIWSHRNIPRRGGYDEPFDRGSFLVTQ